jgi:hypothetical protein
MHVPGPDVDGDVELQKICPLLQTHSAGNFDPSVVASENNYMCKGGGASRLETHKVGINEGNKIYACL